MLFCGNDSNNLMAYSYNGTTWDTATAGGEYGWFGFHVSGNTFNGIVNAIAVNDTTIYFGGNFTAANASNYLGNVGYVVKYDITSGAFSYLGAGNGGNYGVNGAVYAIALNGTDVYIGGDFTTAYDTANKTNCGYVIRYNIAGNSFNYLGAGNGGNYGVNGLVRAIALNSTDVYAGGDFTTAYDTANKTTCGYVIRYNIAGNSFNYVGAGNGGSYGVNTVVRAIALNSTDVYIGGDFWTAYDTVNKTNCGRVIRYNIAGNSFNYLGAGNGGNYGVNSIVYALALNSTDVYIGGLFTTAYDTVNKTTCGRVIRYNIAGNSFNYLGAGNGGNYGVNGTVLALALNGTDVYIGGNFTIAYDTVNKTSCGYVIRYNIAGNSFSYLGSGSGGIYGANAAINALALNSTDVYVGGYLLSVYDTTDKINFGYVTRYNISGNSFNYLGAGSVGNFGVDGLVLAIALNNTDVYLGGDFTTAYATVNKPNCGYVIRYNIAGNSFHYLGAGNGGNYGVDGAVNALALNGTDVYIGGYFTTAYDTSNKTNCGRVIRYNIAGNSFNYLGHGNGGAYGVNSTVLAIALDGTDVYIGGGFTTAYDTVNKTNCGSVIRYNIAGNSFNYLGAGNGGNYGVNNWVNAIALNSTDVYIGGMFSTAYDTVNKTNCGNVIRYNIAGNSFHYLGAGNGGNYGVDGGVYAIALNSTDVYLGGGLATAYDTVNKTNCGRVIRYNIAGNSFHYLGAGNGGNYGVDSAVWAIVLNSTDVYIGGSFTTAYDTVNKTNCGRVIRYNIAGNSFNYLGAGNGGNYGVNNTVYALALNGESAYVGGAFLAAENNISASYLAYYSKTVAADTGASSQFSVVNDSAANIYLTYTNATSQLIYKRFDAGSSTWGSAVTLSSSAVSAPNISLYGSANSLYATWIASNTIYGKSGLISGSDVSWDAAPTALYYAGTNTNLSAPALINGNKLVLTWTSGTSNPYDVKSASVDLVLKTPTLSVGGNWSNSGTFTAGSSTVIFNGTSGTQTVDAGSSNFYNVTINNTGTSVQLMTSNLTQSAGGVLSFTAGTLDLNGKTWTLGANFAPAPTSSARLNISGGTLSGAGYNMTLNNANMTVIHGSGTITVQDYSQSLGVHALAGTLNTRDFSHTGGTFTCPGTASINASGNVVITSAWNNGGSTLTMSGAAKTLNASQALNNLTITGSISLLTNNLDVNGNFRLQSGSFNANSLNQNYAGNFQLDSGTTYTKGGTITFDGGAVQNYTDSTAGIQNIGTVDVTGASTNLNMLSALTCDSLIIQTLSKIVTNNNTLTIGTGGLTLASGSSPGDEGTLDATGTPSIFVAGDWVNAGVFLAGSSTVVFNGSGTQTVVSGGDNFYNVTINNTGGTVRLLASSLTQTPGGVLSFIAGTLNLSGNTWTLGADFTPAPTSAAVLNINFGTLSSASYNMTLNDADMTVTQSSGTITVQDYSHSLGTHTLADTLNTRDFSHTGGTFTCLGTPSINASGNVVITSAWTNTGSTLTMSGAAKTLNASQSLNNLTITGSISLLTNNLDVNGNFRLQSGSFNANSLNQNYAGNFQLDAGTTYTKGGTITFDGGATQNYTDSTAGIQNIGIVVVTGHFSILNMLSALTCDSLTIQNQGELHTNSNTLTVGTGGITITEGEQGGYLYVAGTSSIFVAGNWTGSHFIRGSSTVIFNGASGTQTVNNPSGFYNVTLNNTGTSVQLLSNVPQGAGGVLSFTAGTLDLNGQTWTLGADFSPAPTSAAVLNINGGTLSGAGYNMTLNDADMTVTQTTGTITAQDYSHSLGTHTLAGTLNTRDFSHTGGTFTCSGTPSINASGNVVITSAWTNTGSTLTMSGAAKTLNASQSLNHLTITGSVSLLTNNLDVNGNFRLQSGSFNANSKNQNYAGNFQLDAGTTYTKGGTITFDGGAVQNYTDSTAGIQNIGTLVVTGYPTNLNMFSALTCDGLTIQVEGGLTTHDNTLTIGEGGLDFQTGLLDAGTSTMYIAGNWTGGWFLCGNSTVIFNGASGTQTVNAGSNNFYNVTLNNTGTSVQLITNNVTQSAGGVLSFTAGTLDLNGRTWTLGADFTPAPASSATLNINGGTLSGAGYNMTLNDADMTVTQSSGTITVQDYSHSLGTHTLAGTLNTRDFSHTGGTFTCSGTPAINASGNVVITSAWTNTGSTLTMSGTAKTLNASQSLNHLTITGSVSLLTNNLDVNGNFRLQSGSFNANSLNQNYADNFQLDAGTTYTKGGTITFDGGATQNYTDSTAGIQNIGTVNVTGTSTNLNMLTALTCDGLVILNDGVLTTHDNTLTIGTGGVAVFKNETNNSNLNATGTPSIFVAGNWTTFAFTCGSSTVIFNGATGTQTIYTRGGDFYNATINNTGTSVQLSNNVTQSAGGVLSFTAGTLDLNGKTWTLGADFSPAPTSAAVLNINGGTLSGAGYNMTLNDADMTVTHGSGTITVQDYAHSLGTHTLAGTLNTRDFSHTGGTFTCSGTPSINASGNVVITSAWTNTGSTLTMSGAAKTLNASQALNNLTITGSISLLTNNLDVNGNFRLQSGSFNANSLNQNYAGNFQLDAGTTYTKGGTITFDGGATQNYTDSTAGIQNIGTAVVSSSNLNMLSALTCDGLSITPFGRLTTHDNALTIGTGGLTYASVDGGILDATGTPTIYIAGNWLRATQFYCGFSSVIFNGASQTIAAVSYYNLTFSGSGTKTLAAGTTGVANTFTTGGLTVDATSNSTTVNYNGSGAQTVAALNYYNLTVSNNGIKTVNPATTTIANTGTISGTAQVLLTASATGNNKVYDATDAATVNLSIQNIFTAYTVSLSGSYTATFDAGKNVGTGKAISVTGISLTGADAAKFTLNGVTTASATADITARPLTVTAVTDTKPYDASTSSAGVPTLTSGALQGLDTATWSQTFDTAAVGTGKTLTPSGVATDGNSGNNYSYTYVVNNTGVITSTELPPSAPETPNVTEQDLNQLNINPFTTQDPGIGDMTMPTLPSDLGETITIPGPTTQPSETPASTSESSPESSPASSSTSPSSTEGETTTGESTGGAAGDEQGSGTSGSWNEAFNIYFDPNTAGRLRTNVRVIEGAVYVVDGANRISLLEIGNFVRVPYQRKKPAIKTQEDTGPCREGDTRSSCRGASETVEPEATPAPAMREKKVVSPVVMSQTKEGQWYGTLRNPGKEVFVKSRSGKWVSAQDGMVILPGDEVKTLKGSSAEVLLDDGKIGQIEVREGTLFRINKADVDPKTGDRTTLIDLALGKILVKVEKLKGNSKFEVKTPTSYTGVRGTTFEVSVDEDPEKEKESDGSDGEKPLAPASSDSQPAVV
ncbi:MAG: YDG domain-containing protein [Candidatus Omnitrophota bacterium]